MSIRNRDKNYMSHVNSGKHNMNKISNNNSNISNNNYSLGLYIDNPQKAFLFDENDLKELFSYYKGAQDIRIIPDKAAAQITFNDKNMIQQVKKDINGLTINDIGTIRCIVLNEGKVIEQFLPFSANDPNVTSENDNSVSNNENTVNMLKKLSSLINTNNNNNNNINSNSGNKKRDNMSNRINNINNINNNNNNNNNNSINSNNNFGQLSNNKNEQNDNSFANKRLSRIELIDIFGFPNEFDVMNKILGKNNSNINYINEQTNNMVNIEIKGKPINEAPVVERMHLSITSDNLNAYKKAIDLIMKLLNSLFQEFVDFCLDNNFVLPENLSFKRHEYMYNSDGSTKYLGFKENNYGEKEIYKNDFSYNKKNKNMSKNDNDKRNNNNNSSYNMNINGSYGNNQNVKKW
ncbi:conserved Plasmodium protein, unknown function [Plasmodium sp. gorilla clade G2]|uniref:conserved Plasmodium protein, unknown function n=1 Tax=Plasmodium sp. gorilla clade G2 TaxID=880535 RepID=UPI000D206B78|nr:conserved Plasmodium protein, unknown function [Plasmodium sp. gorilla clade G2]SOV10672.1 conserved Plasmodium protein, unknown function [Plasmodium sp. gorilla clade G2]